MKIKILLFFSVLLLSSSFSVQKASAQWVVNDPAHMGMNLGEWGRMQRNGLSSLMK